MRLAYPAAPCSRRRAPCIPAPAPHALAGPAAPATHTRPLQVRIATQACDVDVQRLCPHDTTASRPTPGVVRDCLAAHLALARQAEAEASGQGDSVPGYAGDAGAGVAAHAVGSARRRRLGELSAAAAAAHKQAGAARGGRTRSEASWRRKQQEAEGGQGGAEGGGQGGDALGSACRAFLEVALPADAYERFQDSMTATGVLTQLAAIESRLGLPHGSLHNPGERRRSLPVGRCPPVASCCALHACIPWRCFRLVRAGRGRRGGAVLRRAVQGCEPSTKRGALALCVPCAPPVPAARSPRLPPAHPAPQPAHAPVLRTFFPPRLPLAAATAGSDVLTVTGWVALAGVFALATLVLALGVFLLRKHTGLGAPNAEARGYTMVIKHETELPQQQGAAHGSPRGLPRRYG